MKFLNITRKEWLADQNNLLVLYRQSQEGLALEIERLQEIHEEMQAKTRYLAATIDRETAAERVASGGIGK